jgi:decaprenylphospho-beta-D-erythro-pentofuranosid-2-ulose 2-reductase
MKNVLIFGGNSDIGFSLGCLFLKSGYRLILTSKNLNELETKKKFIKDNFYKECDIYKFDVTEDNVSNLLKKVNKNINIIIFSNGYLERPEINPEKIMNINYLSIVQICEEIIKNEKINDLKNIIIFSSVAADRGKKNSSTYSSAKAALSLYANELKHRLCDKKISIMNVKIGFVKTKMTSNLKLPPLLSSTRDNVAKIIFNSYLKNKENIYAPGYWRLIMFIWKLIPHFIFKILK